MHVFTHLTKSEHLQKSAFRRRLCKLWDRLFCWVVFISELSLLWAKCWTRWSSETPPTWVKLWAMTWVSWPLSLSIGSEQQQAFVGNKVYFSTVKAWNKHFVYCVMLLLYLCYQMFPFLKEEPSSMIFTDFLFWCWASSNTSHSGVMIIQVL